MRRLRSRCDCDSSTPPPIATPRPMRTDSSAEMLVPVRGRVTSVYWPLVLFVLTPLAMAGAVLLLWWLAKMLFYAGRTHAIAGNMLCAAVKTSPGRNVVTLKHPLACPVIPRRILRVVPDRDPRRRGSADRGTCRSIGGYRPAVCRSSSERWGRWWPGFPVPWQAVG